ncbi:MAG: class I SAM-dependent methyltransferase [Gracilimonas sp.]|nr:class I SAM-dependent methyltransferase [Gracilimonas sp.]MBO6585852.1 class I SAM-dependent methyltransferase [Gracilimonas sp.]MBO6616849.1 class I SAM-dependent methyltransferase [Gracilimonas sp.]
MHSQYGSRKEVLFESHPNVIVEIGAGYGANFRYLRKGTKVKVVEPNAGFKDVLKYQAGKYGVNLEIYESVAEEIPLSDSSAAMVISSLVLCSVKNMPKVLSEVKRILEPEGKFVYLEHVRAHKHSWVCKIQRMVKSSWKWFFDGCNVTRDTGRIIMMAGFSEIKQDEFQLPTFFVPIRPHIAGIAVK